MRATVMLTSTHLFILNSLLCHYLLIIHIRPTSTVPHVDYCQLECKDYFTDIAHENSACKCKQGSNCGDYIHVLRPTEEERKIIVDIHNTLRERVASGIEERGQSKGGATDMSVLSYDYNLEYVAECWAKKCIGRHDECRRTESFPQVGQNFFTSAGQACDEKVLIKAIDMWYEEISGITLGCVLGYGSCMSVGHYTQLAWARTTHIGCARVELSAKTCNVFCNYGPAGNIYGEPLYTIGPPGMHCETRDKVYRSLCVTRKMSPRANRGACFFKTSSSTLLLLLLSFSLFLLRLQLISI